MTLHHHWWYIRFLPPHLRSNGIVLFLHLSPLTPLLFPPTSLWAVVNEKHLLDVIKYLFPNESITKSVYLILHIKSNDKLKEILVNTRKDAQIKDPVTGHNMELDIWIPSKKISFEFQVSSLPFILQLHVFLLPHIYN